ncbi:hypothetical protein [Shewanella woodyi]|uniref:hypothetical protein n=1 Tax=Shewanella woodyi TaxID=60961 RepID=UPI003747FD46
MGVNAAVTFDIKDDVAERIGIYSQRVTEVFAHKVAPWHLTHRDMGNVMMM